MTVERKRPAIPPSVQHALLLANRHACCVCQTKKVQIHHIDGDPRNNVPANLATLCLEHHAQASMQIGLTKKLQPAAIIAYKREWEARCRVDMLALSRDRVNYYVTLYKNPPRIREQFLGLSEKGRHDAVTTIAAAIKEEDSEKRNDAAFKFQMVPKRNEITRRGLISAAVGETWPSFLHRVPGHPEDPDLPVDLSPPHGMTAYHGFDLYCQLLVQVLCVAQSPIPLEDLFEYESASQIDKLAGQMIVFRESATGRNIESPRGSQEKPTGQVTLRRQHNGQRFEAVMQIRNLYVFSDTSAENLRRSRVCGVAILASAEQPKLGKVQLRMIPLLIGMGGQGQSEGGWAWKLK